MRRPVVLWMFFFNSLSGGGVESSWVHSSRRPLIGLLYLPRVIMMMENFVERRLAGKPKYSEKTRPSVTLSTTDPTWPDPGSNPGRRGGKPATNCLSYGTAFCGWLLTLIGEVSSHTLYPECGDKCSPTVGNHLPINSTSRSRQHHLNLLRRYKFKPQRGTKFRSP
jgi:hypothetical protein